MEASKALALIGGRDFVIPEDVKNVIFSVLRHRITLNYAAIADNITSETIINSILGVIPTP
jgi:MoxR-like ATPase